MKIEGSIILTKMIVKMIVGIILLLSLNGCGSFQRGAGEIGAVGGGAVIGRAVTKNTWGAVAGGAGGLALAKIAESQIDKKLDKQYKDGYQMGLAQSTKQSYLAIENVQHPDTQFYNKARMEEVEFPEQEINGQIIKARKELIRVE